MSRFVYRDQYLREISFPLGGIGTGTIGLSGTGRLVDWEIFNKPNKNSLNGFSHFAVKIEEDGHVVDARVLNSDLPPPYTGGEKNYGFGPDRHLMAGVPHFRQTVFTARYPAARIDFLDDTFPADVSLKAFNPMIPLNQDDSALPAACFEPLITNRSDKVRDFVLALSVSNPLPQGKRYNTHLQSGDVHMMRQQSSWADSDDPQFGELTFSVQADRVAWQEDWFHGAWFDSLGIFWRDFTASGDLSNRRYPLEKQTEQGESVATLTARLTLQPGEQAKVRFVLAWYFPNATNYWKPQKAEEATAEEIISQNTWKNHYALLFPDALAVNLYLQQNWTRLAAQTERFQDVLYRSSLPEVALEALTANLSLLRSPTCLLLTDGSFYGFEGCHATSGCCEGSCTHVWNYAYALPYLYPSLERSMRDLDYRYNLLESGEMPFRLQLPLGRDPWSFRACVDGQMGGVVKVYREWRICGDTNWLRRLWPAVKKSLEYAWSPENHDRWDPDKKGYLSGRQHHTLDMELFGPNAWLSGFYLAALLAAARMAEALHETETATLYREIAQRGRHWVNEHLFNGEYFFQQIDLNDVSVLDLYADDTLIGHSLRDAYWNEEAGELKYQIGEGSAIDQVLAQWHCDLIGLDEVFDKDKVQAALQSIFRFNYHDSMRHLFNPCRIYCLNDEGGTTICAWPEGRYKPVVPAPYSEETMHGFEYQAGIHMIMRGMEEEGLKVVKAVRDRYDGEKRNPWNEFECGSNYARSMASYALLLAYSGFTCDMTCGHLSFQPLHRSRPQQFFWSVDAAWGEIRWREGQIELAVLGGSLQLGALTIPEAAQVSQAWLDEASIMFDRSGQTLFFNNLQISAGSLLRLQETETA